MFSKSNTVLIGEEIDELSRFSHLGSGISSDERSLRLYKEGLGFTSVSCLQRGHDIKSSITDRVYTAVAMRSVLRNGDETCPLCSQH